MAQAIGGRSNRAKPRTKRGHSRKRRRIEQIYRTAYADVEVVHEFEDRERAEEVARATKGKKERGPR